MTKITERAKIKSDAIKHYEKMIAWAEMQDPNGRVDSDDMLDNISQNWEGAYCAYCEFYERCCMCPVWAIQIGRHSVGCCGGLWHQMSGSATWKEWLIAAKKVLEFIKIKG